MRDEPVEPRVQNSNERIAEASREQFADGGALVIYPGGGVLIVESNLARALELQEGSTVNYGDPPPPPRVGEVKK